MAFDETVAKLCREHAQAQMVDRFPLKRLHLSKDEIQIRKFPVDREKIYEGITIHPEKEAMGEGSCQTDDIGYAVAATWVRSTGDGIEDIDAFDTFRANIRGMFNNKKPVITAPIFVCTVQFGRFVLPKEYKEHYDASSMLIRYWSEDERI